MIWYVLAMGIVGGIGNVTFIWILKMISSGRFVSPIQKGSLLKRFGTDVKTSGPKPVDDDNFYPYNFSHRD